MRPTPVLPTSAGLGSTLEAPQFSGPFRVPGRGSRSRAPELTPSGGPRAAAPRAPRVTAACVRPASLATHRGSLSSSRGRTICPRTVTTTKALLCVEGRRGLPYRFAYASRPHSGAALSPPKSTLVSFQASYRGPAGL
ncbi:hypothetical protein MRX96_027089 [Rhipicephalus microplus]